MDTKAQSGNVLFIILIAVALFAALSYAVTKSQRVGEGGADKDKAKIKATQILDYSAYLAQIYQRLILRGVAPASVRYFAPGNNDICRTGAGCLFSPEGGGGVGHSVDKLPFNIQEYPGGMGAGGFYLLSAYPTSPDYGGLSMMGTNNADTALELDYLPRDICSAINKLTTGSETIPSFVEGGVVSGVSIYHGTLPPGQAAGCFELCIALGDTNPCYSFMRVLEER